MAIKREDVVTLLAYNIAWERWGERGHEPSYWDYGTAESNIKILQEAGYDIVKIEKPKGIGDPSRMPEGPIKDPRWAEPDDVPEPSSPYPSDWADETRTKISFPINAEDVPMYEEQIAQAKLMNQAAWPSPEPSENFVDAGQCISPLGTVCKDPVCPVHNPLGWNAMVTGAKLPEPPVEEPIPSCTQTDKKRFSTKAAAIAYSDGLKLSLGERYQTLYPYECSAGGHWHLSHYQQGKVKCPVCQIKQNAWKGGESYWVMARHVTGDAGLVCRGTGKHVYNPILDRPSS